MNVVITSSGLRFDALPQSRSSFKTIFPFTSSASILRIFDLISTSPSYFVFFIRFRAMIDSLARYDFISSFISSSDFSSVSGKKTL